MMEFFSVALSSPSSYMSVWNVVVNGPLNVVHVLLTDDFFQDWSLVTLTTDLEPIDEVSLNGLLVPPIQLFDDPLDAPLVDKNGVLYIVRTLRNSTTLVHVLQNGVQIDVWQAPFATPNNLGFVTVAMGSGSLIHFQWFQGGTLTGQPLYVTTTGGLLVATLRLNTNFTDAYGRYGVRLAVSRNSGNIAISLGDNIALFTSSGVRLSSFNYVSPLSYYDRFSRLAFDASDRLLAVDEDNEYGVQIISTTNGDLLGTLASPVPELSYVQHLHYERQTKSLLLSQPGVTDVPVLRLDADNGWLVQEYPLLGRYQDCFTLTSAVSASTGNIYNLLVCGVGGELYYGTLLLQATTPAGRLVRETVLGGLRFTQILYQLVVDEDRGLFYMLAGPLPQRNTAFTVVAFGFNGTNMYNFTDSRIGTIRTGAQLLPVTDHTIGVVDNGNNRILVLDVDSHSLSNTLTIPRGVDVDSAVYAAGSWYLAESVFDTRTRLVNISLNQYTNGSLTQQLFFEIARVPRTAVLLAVDNDARRLYCWQGLRGSFGASYILYWDFRRFDGQQQQHEKQQMMPKQIEVRGAQQSGRQALTEERSSVKWASIAQEAAQRTVRRSAFDAQELQ